MWLQRLYVLFFIELGSRRVLIDGCTPTPTAGVGDTTGPTTHLELDRPHRTVPLRDPAIGTQKFTDSFDEVFRSAECEIIRTPFRAPQAKNGVAERFVRTVRSECLDWRLILNEQHLRHVLVVFVAHYDSHRPHRALGLKATSSYTFLGRASDRAGRDSCRASRSARWIASRVRPGSVTGFSHPTRYRLGVVEGQTLGTDPLYAQSKLALASSSARAAGVYVHKNGIIWWACNNEIRVAVAIEVPNSYEIHVLAYGEWYRRSKGASAVTEESCDTPVRVRYDRQITTAVQVEVCTGAKTRAHVDGDHDLGCAKGSIASTVQH
jgi:hypothetical protein